MPSEATFWMMAGAMVCSTIALAASAIASYRIMKVVMGLKDKIEPLVPKLEDTLMESARTLQAAREELRDVGERTSRFFDSANDQLEALDKTRADVTDRLMIQIERAELVADDTLARVHEVVGALHSGVLRPVREVNGILNGVKTAIATFAQGRRPSVERATQDEEMFI